MSTVTFYSDSLDVLWWIRGHGKDFRAFVANRVGEIQMFSDPQQWQHVATEQNPADLVSRGVNVEDLKENALWWNGPDWLLKKEDNWPRVSDDNPPTEMKESRKPTVLASHSLSRRMEIKPKSVLILDASRLHLRTSRSSSVQHAEEGESGIWKSTTSRRNP